MPSLVTHSTPRASGLQGKKLLTENDVIFNTQENENSHKFPQQMFFKTTKNTNQSQQDRTTHSEMRRTPKNNTVNNNINL